MTHSPFSHRHSFREARLLRFAAETPASPDAPPPAESKGEKGPSTPDPKAAFRKAQERIQIHGEKLNALRAKLQPLQTLQAKHEAGEDLKTDELKRHGVEDADADGKLSKGELDAKVKEIEDKLQPHQEALDAARGESDTSLKSIESQGAGGKLDAAFMRVDAVMKDPNASVGEKLAAVLMAFAEVQAVFRGIASPESGSANGKGPEANRTSPQGKRETVRQMMKDAGKAKVADLLADKNAGLAGLKAQRGGLEGALAASKTALGAEQLALTNAKANLETDKDNVAKQTAVRQAESKVTIAEGAVKAAEQQLASLNADIAKAEADVKIIKEVSESGQKSVDDFNHGRQAVAANLFTMLDKNKVVASGSSWDQLEVVRSALADSNAVLAPNGLDVQLTVPNMQDFLKPFVDNGVDAKDLQVNSDGSLKDPNAFLATVEKLISKVRTDADKKKGDEKK